MKRYSTRIIVSLALALVTFFVFRNKWQTAPEPWVYFSGAYEVSLTSRKPVAENGVQSHELKALVTVETRQEKEGSIRHTLVVNEILRNDLVDVGTGLQGRAVRASYDMKDRVRGVFVPIGLSFSEQQILLHLLDKIHVPRSLQQNLERQERDQSGIYQAKYVRVSNPDEQLIRKTKTREQNARQGASKPVVSGAYSYTIKDGDDIIMTLSGEETTALHDQNLTPAGDSTLALVMKRSHAEISTIPDPSRQLERFDTFDDNRMQIPARTAVWLEKLKGVDMDEVFEKLRAPKIGQEDKVRISQILEAWLALDPSRVGVLEEMISSVDPESDAFHLSCLIVANLMTKESNEAFARLASEFRDRTTSLENLMLYYNDLRYPDTSVMERAKELAENLNERSGTRAALALGSMIHRSGDWSLKDQYDRYLRDRLQTAQSKDSKTIWLTSLGNAAHPDSLPVIIEYTHGADIDLVLTAINAVRKYPWDQVQGYISAWVQHPDERIILQTIKVMKDMPVPPSEHERLLDFPMKHTHEGVRKQALALKNFWTVP